MDALGNLAKTPKDNENISEQTILKTIDILKEINDEESEIIEDIIENIADEEITDEDIAEDAQEYMDTLISDANIVYEGIEQFAKAVTSNGEITSEFLKKVWHGDMYDCEQIEGLEHLLYDLRKNLSLLTNSNIVTIVSGRLEKRSNSTDLED